MKKYLVIGFYQKEKLYAEYKKVNMFYKNFIFSRNMPLSGFTLYANTPSDAINKVLMNSSCSFRSIVLDNIEAIEIVDEEKDNNKHDESKKYVSQSSYYSTKARIVVITNSGKTLYLNKKKIYRTCISDNTMHNTISTFEYEFLEDSWWLIEKSRLNNPRTWDIQITPDQFDFDSIISMIIKKYNDAYDDKIKEYKVQEQTF